LQALRRSITLVILIDPATFEQPDRLSDIGRFNIDDTDFGERFENSKGTFNEGA
jgi:hypothetical protein